MGETVNGRLHRFGKIPNLKRLLYHLKTALPLLAVSLQRLLDHPKRLFDRGDFLDFNESVFQLLVILEEST